MSSLMEKCKKAKLIPVMVIEDIHSALPLAQALIENGFNVLEVTLRTECAIEAIQLISDAFPHACVGAGTIKNSDDLYQVIKSGAAFGVSPGTTQNLLDRIKANDFPFIPGCATVSEAMTLSDQGFNFLKLFPAHSLGGIDLLKSFSSPFPHLKFCPTGGINQETVSEYLALSNVICVGGSWILPQNLLKANDYKAIKKLCAETHQLLNQIPC